MNKYKPYAGVVEELAAAGLPPEEAYDWLMAQPAGLIDFATDCRTSSKFWEKTSKLLARLPHASRRQQSHRVTAQFIQQTARDWRTRFLRQHVKTVYDALTHNRSRFLRVGPLVEQAAEIFPGLVPTKQQIAEEESCLQSEKTGREID